MATATPRPLRRAAPTAARPAPLRVVRGENRARTVGAIGSIVAGFFFAVLFALAGLHAVVVQTQARLDAVNADIAALEEVRIHALAERARFDSPEGIAELASAAGLVEAPMPVLLAPVAPGMLEPPPVSNPFGPEGTSASPTAGGVGG